METLIMSCSTGGGHNAAAHALQEELERRGHTVTLLDPYTLVSEALAKRIGNLYIGMVQRLPRLFGAVYQAGELYRRIGVHSPVYAAQKGMEKQLLEHLNEHSYDVILFTHLFPGMILTRLREKGIALPPTIFVATDYTCIPLAEEVVSDYCVIPSADLEDEFIGRGVCGKLLPYGIPVRSAFRQKQDADTRLDAIKRLGLDADKRYLLLAGGSMGAGKLGESIDALKDVLAERPDYMLIAICGSNEALFHKLAVKYSSNKQMIMLPYTDRFADYMAASDLLMSKPGGITSTEAATLGIPLVHIPPIPGCETINAAYFAERGMSIRVTSQKGLRYVVQKILDDKKGERMIAAQRKWVNPNATVDICDFAEKCAIGASRSDEYKVF